MILRTQPSWSTKTSIYSVPTDITNFWLQGIWIILHQWLLVLFMITGTAQINTLHTHTQSEPNGSNKFTKDSHVYHIMIIAWITKNITLMIQDAGLPDQ